MSERLIQTHIAYLKTKGFVTVTIQNRYERVIRAAGKYARVHGEALRQLHRDSIIIARIDNSHEMILKPIKPG